MPRLITVIGVLVLLTAIAVGSRAEARNDGQENGAGCVNNCGNTSQTEQTLPIDTTITVDNAFSSQSSTTNNVSVGSTDLSVGGTTVAVGVEAPTLYVQSNVKYKEAAQAVHSMVATACGESQGFSTPGYSISLGKGQDAFCKQLVMADIYFGLGDSKQAMKHIEIAKDLAGLDAAFDQILTVLSVGLLK